MPAQTEYEIPDEEKIQRQLNYVLVLLAFEAGLLLCLSAWILLHGWGVM